MKNHTVGNFMLSTLTYLFHGQSSSVILLVECSHNIVPDRLMYGLHTLLVPLQEGRDCGSSLHSLWRE